MKSSRFVGSFSRHLTSLPGSDLFDVSFLTLSLAFFAASLAFRAAIAFSTIERVNRLLSGTRRKSARALPNAIWTALLTSELPSLVLV